MTSLLEKSQATQARPSTRQTFAWFWLLLALAFLLPTLTMSEQLPRCAACGKLITGGYRTVGNLCFHPNHFKCALCGQPIKGTLYFEDSGKYYDSTCFMNSVAPRCGVCGLPILGSYVVYDGKNYHESCYATHIVPRCSLCGDTIMGKYLVDFWGDKYHQRHEGVDPRCAYCNRFISQELTHGGTKYPDGRTICSLCLVTAVTDDDTARQILGEVQDSLAKLGIIVKRKKIPLNLVDSKEMARHSGEVRLDAAGFTEFEKTKYVYGLITDRKFQVYALWGVPRHHLEAILAHELMHVWLGLNAPMYQNQFMVEGSCNYAEFLYLGADTCAADRFLRQNMLEDTDPVYGEGFRKIKAFVEANGEPSWLEYVKKNESPPW